MARKIIAAALLVVMLFTMAACAQWSYSDEIQMMYQVLKYFDDYDTLTVNVLEKYNVSETEIYYYVEWVYPENGDNDTYEFLVIYNTQSQIAKLAHFKDMEAGYKADIKKVWDEIKTQEPDRTFTRAEIKEIIDEAAVLKEKIDQASAENA